jgi:hypothetical protein
MENMSDSQIDDHSNVRVPRHTRRLSDRILVAFHQACDQDELEVAEQLLGVLEMMLSHRPLAHITTRRRNVESLVAAHERLWNLRHPVVEEFRTFG